MVLNKVAITGGSGMVGRHLITALVKKGISCIATSRTEPDTKEDFFSWEAWDLQEWKSVDELNVLFAGVSAIMHIGAAVPNSAQILSHKTIFDSNVRSCLCLGQWALESRIPMIFLSGATVYANPDGEGICENADKAYKAVQTLGGFYGFSKLLAEEVLLNLAVDGLQLCILRPSSIYGFGLHREKMISKFITQASRGEIISLQQPIDDKIDLIHASDVADAAVQALEGKAQGIYNIASGTLVTVLEIAQTCVKVVGNGKVEIKAGMADRAPILRFGLNCDAARESFGFLPKINLCEGIARTWHELQKERC